MKRSGDEQKRNALKVGSHSIASLELFRLNSERAAFRRHRRAAQSALPLA